MERADPRVGSLRSAGGAWVLRSAYPVKAGATGSPAAVSPTGAPPFGVVVGAVDGVVVGVVAVVELVGTFDASPSQP